MGTFYVSVFDIHTRKLVHEKVPENVYVYIKQLESNIKYPELSALKNIYDFRFIAQ